MKNLSRVVLGSVAGSLLGAASFFAIDGLIPSKAEAQVYGVNIQSSPFGSDLDVYLQSSPFSSDKDVYIAGKCSGTANTDVYIQSSPFGSDEDWYIQSSPFGADMEICLSGDLEHWFENAN